jgi:hypothetical protein
MSKFAKKDRQRIIDGYLSNTGRNMFIPAEFVDWLSGQPEHEAYNLFYGLDDAEAARQYRIDLARNMASGLRIVATESSVGGGYHRFDPDDEGNQTELRRQGATALSSWIERYRGCAEKIGIDMSALERVVEDLRADAPHQQKLAI